MRLVLDTNIIISGLIWGGIPRQLLDLGRNGEITFFTSNPLLDELASVLERKKFAKLLASKNITPAFLMQHYAILAILVKPKPIERIVRDVDDDIVIATALAAEANIIATGDNDLLVLHPWEGTQILNAADTLKYILNKKIKIGK